MEFSWETIKARIQSLGGEGPDYGINWTWAYFASDEDAAAFETWVRGEMGCETRGVYPMTDRDFAGVRFR